MEIFEGETIFACNVCNEGFEDSDSVKIHISDRHKEVVKYIIDEQEEKGINDIKDTESGCKESFCLLEVGKCVCRYLEE